MSSSLTKSQIAAFNPGQLLELGAAWTKMATSIEDLFARYNDKVTRENGTYWTGVTADAAVARAGADLRSARTVAAKLESLADQATQGFWTIDAPLQRTRSAIAAAEAAGFEVSENLSVFNTKAGPPSQATQDAMKSHAQAIQQGALDLFNADLGVKNGLSALRPGLVAAFTSAASVGSEEGTADGKSLATDPHGLSPEALRRLVEAGRLSPDDLEALKTGDPVSLSASQMEYINTVMRGLDGKSPQEIESILNGLPPDAKAGLANMLQLGSHNNVKTGITGDAEVPTHGGLAVLPAQMKQSLTRTDLVSSGMQSTPGYPGSNVGGKRFALNGVADNQAIGRIVGMSDPNYRQGSELDHSLMDVTRQYLHAQVQAEQAGGEVRFTVDGHGARPTDRLTEDLLGVLSPDTFAVRDAVSDPNTGMEFVTDLHTHEFADNGVNAGRLFTFGDHEMTVEDWGDRLDVAQATRAGDIMEAVARAEHSDAAWKLLSSIPGTDGKSFGELNPSLLQAISRSLSEYTPDLVGDDQHPGFDVAGLNDGTYRGTANIVAVMNTDPTAGEIFNSKLMADQLEYARQFGHDPANVEAMTSAGRLSGVLDRGVTLAAIDQNGRVDAAEAYERKVASFERLKSLASAGLNYAPHDIMSASDATGLTDAMKNMIIGPKPDTSVPFGPDGNLPHLDGANEQTVYYAALQAAGPLPPDIASLGGDFVDPQTRQLKPFDQISTGENDVAITSRLKAMFNQFAGVASSSNFLDEYNAVNTNGTLNP